MSGWSYGQFCGMARAFEILGARWTPLVIRDLLLGPKLFSDLHAALPRVEAAELEERLADLEAAGVVVRGIADDEAVYDLTAYGKDLEPLLLGLGLWGARSLGDPRPGDLFSLDIAILALRATFRPDRARGVHVTFEVRFGDLAVNVIVDDGELIVAEGPLPGADLIIKTPVLKHLMAGELSPTDALWLGLIDAKGDPGRLTTFVQLFHIPESPELPAPAH